MCEGTTELPDLDEPAPRRLKLRDPALVHCHPGWRKEAAALARCIAARVQEASPKKDRCSLFAWPVACGDGRKLEIFVCLLRDLETLDLGERDVELLLAVTQTLLFTDAFQVSSVTWRPLLATSLRCALHRVFPGCDEAAKLLDTEICDWWTIERADVAYNAFVQHHSAFLRQHVSLLTGIPTKKLCEDGSWSLNATTTCSGSLFTVPEGDGDDESEGHPDFWISM